MINTIDDIIELTINDFHNWSDYGHIYTTKRGNLVLFNYLSQAQYEGKWTFLERVSRGLIINKLSGEVVARPFDKFFNWGENNYKSISPIKYVTEKLDGSLGILYRDNGFKIATRGSFESKQAEWATNFLNNNYQTELIELKNSYYAYTLLFEIVYPENRIVVDYKGFEGLYLIGARNRFTGEYLSYPKLQALGISLNFRMPRRYNFKNTDEILSKLPLLPYNKEGWVVEFYDKQRLKFKGKEYLKIHRFIHNISLKNTLSAYINNEVNELLNIIPDEFMVEVNSYIEQIKNTIKSISNEVEKVFKLAPKKTRKEFAIWVTKNHKNLANYLFAKLDGKEILPLIYKMGFTPRDA